MLYTLEFLNNCSKIYYAGNTLYGCLNISLDREKTIYALKVIVYGRANVVLKSGKSSAFQKQIFIEETALEFAQKHLTVGNHRFNFEVKLPGNCPPSFKGEHGFIKYEVIVIIPKLFSSGKHPHEFTIISYSPLPFFEFNFPLKIHISSTNKVTFPKNVFRTGENIMIEVNIDQNIPSGKMDFFLVQYIFYQADNWITRLEQKEKNSVVIIRRRTSSETIYQECIKIPDNVPTTLEYLEILKIRYFIKIVINGKKFKLPIVIGDFYKTTD
ncbi:hypothetical protein ACFFRR_003115 [Megaselia abdita]